MTTVVEAQDLSIGYHTRRSDVVIARKLQLTLAAGELACLLGPNGAGKSTLMRTLAGMQLPLGGRVLLMGEDIAAMPARRLATRLSVVLTERPNVGLLSGYGLVALGRHPYTDWRGHLSAHDEAVVRWAVEAVGAGAFAERPVMELSDGQRQKLMIARALAQDTQAILLDEPTAYLDLPRRAEIMQLLRRLAAETGRAILLSTHDLDLALRTADTLWLMTDGGVRVGSPEDLVLSGAFEAAFRGEGVAFDRATGAFVLEDAAQRAVAVAGDGIPQTWTRHALRRAGFAVRESDAPLCVEVTEALEGTRWRVYRVDGLSGTYASIADLLASLRETPADDEGER